MIDQINSHISKAEIHAFCDEYNIQCATYSILSDVDDITLKINSTEGGSYALTIFRLSDRIDSENVADRCEWIEILRNNVSFEVAYPIRNRNQECLTEVGGEAFAKGMLLNWVDGEKVSRSLNGETVGGCGQILAELHNIAEKEGAGMCLKQKDWGRS